MECFGDAPGAAAPPCAAAEESVGFAPDDGGGPALLASFRGLAEDPAGASGEYQALAQQYAPSAVYPWSAVVQVVVQFPNGLITSGSGVMVGRNDALTAGHIVYQPAWGGFASSVLVVPASDPALVFNGPFGSSPAYITAADTGFDPDGDRLIAAGNRGPDLAGSERDVAFLSLQRPLGDSTGWMALDPTFVSGYVNLSGYPSHYGGYLTNDQSFAYDDPVDQFTNISAFEARPGNSGGPVWHYAPGGVPYLVGIVSSGSLLTGRGLAAFDVATSYNSILGWIASNDHLIA